MASEAERLIRAEVEAVQRVMFPGYRIIHELNVDHGVCRVDLAAIGKDEIIFTEIKSKKDKLTRLQRQTEVFGRACHGLIVVLDEKFFGDRYAADRRAYEFRSARPLWRWPRPEPSQRVDGHWRAPVDYRGVQPHARRLLELLWRDELHAVCGERRIAATKRTSRWPMIRDIAWLCTGREIAESVCRQLRRRPMAEGDPPCLD